MLAGHVAGEGRRTDVFAGNTIYSLMSDYQSGYQWRKWLPEDHAVYSGSKYFISKNLFPLYKFHLQVQAATLLYQ